MLLSLLVRVCNCWCCRCSYDFVAAVVVAAVVLFVAFVVAAVFAVVCCCSYDFVLLLLVVVAAAVSIRFIIYQLLSYGNPMPRCRYHRFDSIRLLLLLLLLPPYRLARLLLFVAVPYAVSIRFIPLLSIRLLSYGNRHHCKINKRRRNREAKQKGREMWDSKPYFSIITAAVASRTIRSVLMECMVYRMV